ncbi:MAG: hypothetical protein ACREJD_10260 [Phycisphaerales bacterium]
MRVHASRFVSSILLIACLSAFAEPSFAQSPGRDGYEGLLLLPGGT